MIQVKEKINYEIDWHSDGVCIAEDKNTVLDNRIHYFRMLRNFLEDLDGLDLSEVEEVFRKYNIHFVDIDEIPRVNIDELEI